MAQVHLSDEILMAFADGELEESGAAMVEKAMASDPVIAKRVAEFLRSRRLVRSAFPDETITDVSPELRAAVQVQIDRLEPPSRQKAPLRFQTKISAPFAGKWPLGMALAAGVAGLAVATAGYLLGHQNSLLSQASGSVEILADPQVGRILEEARSGEEQDLPFGRIRVVSTFRVANGALCREFKLQAPSGAWAAVACRNGNWRVTFAVAEAANAGAYVPSGGGDLMEIYLQNAGAGEPLQDAAEIEALSKTER
jgi:cytochrome P450